jgi:hypothetical protein
VVEGIGEGVYVDVVVGVFLVGWVAAEGEQEVLSGDVDDDVDLAGVVVRGKGDGLIR